MDPPALVTDQISMGSAILRQLDEARIPVRAALWMYDNSATEWRFVVATPMADKVGPRKAYEAVNRTLKSSSLTKDFPIWRLALKSPRDRLFTLLGELIGTLDSSSGLSLTLSVPGDDPSNVLVYRVN